MLIQKIKNNLTSSKSFTTFFKNQKIGLAVSGGIDSMVLLDVFYRISREYNLKLYVMHYNHKWRKESFRDARLVKKYCKENKIRFLYKENKGKVIKDEETAREQRYSFFESCAKKFSLKIICTAHHEDDQVETILFRLARGTGPNGLYPIKEYLTRANKISFYRPFLSTTKAMIRKYALQNKIRYIEDKTNLDLMYKRNLVRRKIVPLLRRINPKVENNILSFSNLAYSQNIALGNYFSVLLKRIKTDSLLSLNRKEFLKLDCYTQTAFVYWFFTRHGIKGALSKINFIRDAIKNQKKVDLSKKYIMNSAGNKIVFAVK